MSHSPFSTLLSSALLAGLGVTASCCGAAPVVVALAGVVGGLGASGIYDKLQQVKKNRDANAAIQGNHDLARLIIAAVKSVFDELVQENLLGKPSIKCLKILNKAKLKIPVDKVEETDLPNLFTDAVGEYGEVEFSKVRLLDVESWRKILINWLRDNKTATESKDDQTTICEHLRDRTASYIAEHLKQDFANEGEGRAFAGLQLMFFARLTLGLDQLANNLETRSAAIEDAIVKFKQSNIDQHDGLVRKLKRWLRQVDESHRTQHRTTWALITDSYKSAGIRLDKIEDKIDDVKSATDRLEATAGAESAKLDRLLADHTAAVTNTAAALQEQSQKLEDLNQTIVQQAKASSQKGEDTASIHHGLGEPNPEELAAINLAIAEFAGEYKHLPFIESESSYLNSHPVTFADSEGKTFHSLSQALRRKLLSEGRTPFFQELKRIFPSGDSSLEIYVERRIDQHFNDFERQQSANIFSFANSSGSGKSTFLAKRAYELSRSGHLVFFITGSEIATNVPRESILDATMMRCGYEKSRFTAAISESVFNDDGVLNWKALLQHAQSHRRQVYFFVDALDRASPAFPGELASLVRLLINQIMELCGKSIRIVLSCRSEVWENEKIDSLFAQEDSHLHHFTYIPDSLKGMELSVGSGNLESEIFTSQNHVEVLEKDEGSFTKSTYEAAFDVYQDYYSLTFENETSFRDENFQLLREPLMMRMFFVSEKSRASKGEQVAARKYRRWQLVFEYVMDKRKEIRSALNKAFSEEFAKLEQRVDFNELLNELITSAILILSVEVLCDRSNSFARKELEASTVKWLNAVVEGRDNDRILARILPRLLRRESSREFLIEFGKVFQNFERFVSVLFESGLNVELFSEESSNTLRYSLDLYYEFCLGRAVGNVILESEQPPGVVFDALFYQPSMSKNDLLSKPGMRVDFDRVEETPLFSNQFLANTLQFAILQIEQGAKTNEELDLTVQCLQYLTQKPFPYQKLACRIVSEFAVFEKDYINNRKKSRIQNLLREADKPERLVKQQIQQIIHHCLIPISNRGDIVCRFALSQAIVALRRANRVFTDKFLDDWHKIDTDNYETMKEYGEKSSTAEMMRAISIIDAWGSKSALVDSENATTDLRKLIGCVTKQLSPEESEIQFWIRRIAAVSTVQFIKKQIANSNVGVDADEIKKVIQEFVIAIRSSRTEFEQAMLSEQLIYLIFVTRNEEFEIIWEFTFDTDNDWQKTSILFALINVHNHWHAHQNSNSQQYADDAPWLKKLHELIQRILSNREHLVDDPSPPFRMTLERFLGGLERIVESNPSRLSEDELFDTGTNNSQMLPVDSEKIQVMFSPEFYSNYFDNHHECRERIYSLLQRFQQINQSDSPAKIGFEFVEPARLESRWLHDYDPYFGPPIHEREYVEKVERLSQFLESREDLRDDAKHLQVDIRPGSFGAALRSAGSAEAAVNAAMENRFGLAICFNRPPGHLAKNQICIFNNVAAGVRHAQRSIAASNNNVVPRITVLDVDAHHGLNLQQCFYSDCRVAYVSIHQDNIHPGEGFVWQIGADMVRDDDNEFNGVGSTLNFPVSENAEHDKSVAFSKVELTEHLELHQPAMIFVACGADADFRDPFAQLKFDPESYYLYGKTISEWRNKQENANHKPIPVVVVFEGGFGITNGGISEPYEALVHGLVGNQCPEYLTDSKPGNIPTPKRQIDPVRSILCQRDFKIASPAPFQLNGDVRNILSSAVVEADVAPFDLEPTTFGIGAAIAGPSSIPEGQSGNGIGMDRIGELLICGGKALVQCPLKRQPIEVAGSVSSPFVAAWHGVPRFWMRLRTWRTINLDGMLHAITQAFDNAYGTLGIIGAIRTESLDTIREKRLILAPTVKNRDKVLNSAKEPVSIVDNALDVFFESGIDQFPKADQTIWFSGVVARTNPEFTKLRMSRQQIESGFYLSPLSPTHREFRQHHLHFALMQSSSLDTIWADSPIKSDRFLKEVESLGDKAILVSHLEDVAIQEAYVGIIPLNSGPGRRVLHA